MAALGFKRSRGELRSSSERPSQGGLGPVRKRSRIAWRRGAARSPDWNQAPGKACTVDVQEPVQLASQPAIMGKVLGIVYRTLATHLTKKAGYTKTTAHTGAVTLIHRFHIIGSLLDFKSLGSLHDFMAPTCLAFSLCGPARLNHALYMRYTRRRHSKYLSGVLKR
jgi:hypothetical protein